MSEAQNWSGKKEVRGIKEVREIGHSLSDAVCIQYDRNHISIVSHLKITSVQKYSDQ